MRRDDALAALACGPKAAKELAEFGIARSLLNRMVEEGALVRLARGVYARADHETDTERRIAGASLRIGMRAGSGVDPVVCLETAAMLHGLTTRHVGVLWIALPYGSRTPKPEAAGMPVRTVQMRPDLLFAGVERMEVGSREMWITTPARTVVDLFRFATVRGRGRRDGPAVEEGTAYEALQKALADGVAPSEIEEVAHEFGGRMGGEAVLPLLRAAHRQQW